MIKEYNIAVQKLFIQMMASKSELFTRVSPILNSQNFDKSLRDTIDLLKAYSNKYNALPDVSQLNAVLGIDLQHVPDIEKAQVDWFLDEFEQFTRRQELERAIIESADLLEKGEYEPVVKKIKDAVQISLQRDLGTDYFANPRGRLLAIKDKNGQVSTGWKPLDDKLFGGFNRGELNLFSGGSGSGKSLFMQNLAVNWVKMGMSGVYITLELSEELCSMRIDSMITGVNTRSIFQELDAVELKVRIAAKTSGKLRVKYLPAQSNINAIRAYCKELAIQSDLKIDFLCIDYLDLLMPVSVKISPSDMFIKDKYVSEELRNLAKELNVVLVTASQLNRSAVDEVEFDHSHIAGGISKIQTCDNMFGIYTSRSMRERGQYQLQLMKTRSSNGVGQKIELDYNNETLRLTANEEKNNNPSTKPVDIAASLKPKNFSATEDVETIVPVVDVPKITADIRSAKLKNVINGLSERNT